MSRKKGSMEIDAAVGREIDDGSTKDLSIGHDDDEVGLEGAKMIPVFCVPQ